MHGERPGSTRNDEQGEQGVAEVFHCFRPLRVVWFPLLSLAESSKIAKIVTMS